MAITTIKIEAEIDQILKILIFLMNSKEELKVMELARTTLFIFSITIIY